MTFFSSAVRSRDGPEDEAEEDAGAVSELAAEGVRSDVMVLVDDPAQAASAKLVINAAIALQGIVDNGRIRFSRRKLSIIGGRLQ